MPRAVSVPRILLVAESEGIRFDRLAAWTEMKPASARKDGSSRTPETAVIQSAIAATDGPKAMVRMDEEKALAGKHDSRPSNCSGVLGSGDCRHSLVSRYLESGKWLSWARRARKRPEVCPRG